MGLYACQSKHPTGTLVLPKTMAPADSSRATASHVASLTTAARAGSPAVVTCHGKLLLDGHGKAMQHSEHLSAARSLSAAPGFCTRLEVTNDHRVQATVQTLHALNEDLEQRYVAASIRP